MSYTPKTTCRLCGVEKLTQVGSLPPTPPANALQKTAQAARDLECYPLDLLLCTSCKHLQLGGVVPPEQLFGDYKYVTGTMKSFVKHFDDYADALVKTFNLQARRKDPGDPDNDYPGDLVVEFGSNDGSMLKRFKEKHGLHVLGVEPATAIAAKANEDGIPTVNGFFSHKFNLVSSWCDYRGKQPAGIDLTRCYARGCNRIFSTIDYGRDRCPKCDSEVTPAGVKARLVIANNVMAHIDDLAGCASAIQEILHPTHGVFVFEVSYLGDVLEKGLWDTSYHEHLDMHSVWPLKQFFEKHGLFLFDVQRVPTHGGSIRCFVRIGGSSFKTVWDLIDSEKATGKGKVSTYVEAIENFKTALTKLKASIDDQKTAMLNGGSSYQLVAYGAAAKTVTLLATAGLTTTDIDYIVDDSPFKQGLFLPGSGIPIVGFEKLLETKPNFVLITAWNYSSAIVDKIKVAFLEKGLIPPKCIIPLPELTVV